jgi:tetratricopeptide (TPR) repeat protein
MERAFLCFGCGALVSPDNAFTHREMAKLLQYADRRDQALLRFSRALTCQPLDPDSHNDLGKLAFEGKKIDQASRHFRKAAIIAPAHATTVKNLALAAQAQHDAPTTLTWHQRAAGLEPNDAELQSNLAESLLVAGRFEEAEPILLRAAELAPDNARIHYALAQGRTATSDDPERAILQRLARTTDSNDHEAQSLIHFALAKISLDLEEREAWFDHLLVANAARRALTIYDEPATMSQFQRVKEIFTPEFLAQWRGVGNKSAQPVFIVGMPRSGSTLVEQILASHPKVHAAGELSDFRDLLDALALTHNEIYPDLATKMTKADFSALADDYHARLAALSPLSERITDKALGNFWYIGLIHLLFPNAKIIHTRRDPVDTCLSCFSRSFRDLIFTYDLAELGRYWVAYDDVMRHWHDVLPEGTLLDIDYEKLVADLPGQTARLLDYCQIEWDDNCLDFHRTERPVRTASFMQVRKEIYKTSVGRWRPAAEKLAPLLDALAGAGA